MRLGGEDYIMRYNHPGIFECKGKDSGKLHWWNIRDNGTSSCRFCKLELDIKQTDELELTRKDYD